MKEVELQELLDFMTKQPRAVQQAMIAFPPRCTVKAVVPLYCPAPNSFGTVTGYVEHEHTVNIRVDDQEVAAECEQEWLEVVSFHDGVTSEAVRAICGLE